MNTTKSINAVTTEKAFWQSMLMLTGIVLMMIVVGSAILVSALNQTTPEITTFDSSVEGNHIVLSWNVDDIDDAAYVLKIEKELNGQWMVIEDGLSSTTTRTYVANHRVHSEPLAYRLSIVDANGNVIEQELITLD